MNYFDHHIGDYAAATAHLSLLEDGCYSRMLRRYYLDEKPLPADKRTVFRLIGARTDEEQAAADMVLSEFFDLRDDGWHNKRADAEIKAYQDGEPEREIKRANQEARVKRHREERAQLFAILADAGHHPSWNIPISALRTMVLTCNAPVTVTGPLPVTETATPATATQEPLTINQEPVTNIKPIDDSLRSSSSSADADDSTLDKVSRKRVPAQQILDAYNAELGDVLPKAQALNRQRKSAINARYCENLNTKSPNGRIRYSDPDSAVVWFAAVWRKVRTNPFWMGENERGWTADLDWLLKPTNFQKVVEWNQRAGK